MGEVKEMQEMQEIIIVVGNHEYNQKLEKVFSSLSYQASCPSTISNTLNLIKKGKGGLVVTSVVSPFFDDIYQNKNWKKYFWDLMVLVPKEKEEHFAKKNSDDLFIIPFPCKCRELVEKAQEILEEKRTAFLEKEFNMDLNGKVISWKGENVEMTTQEMALFKVFIDSPGQVLSREVLYSKAWGYKEVGESRTVDVHVQRLRKKLGNKGTIETIYNQGYRFAFTG